MKLDNLYSLRRNFTVIGLTGRTGSGCTKIASLLGKTYNNLKKDGLRSFDDSNDNLFIKKFNIVENYISHNKNWQKFDVINYRNVLLFFLINKISRGNTNEDLFLILSKYYRESPEEDNKNIVLRKLSFVLELLKTNQTLVDEIAKFNDFNGIKEKNELIKLNELFFNTEFKEFSKEIFKILISDGGYFRSQYSTDS